MFKYPDDPLPSCPAALAWLRQENSEDMLMLVAPGFTTFSSGDPNPFAILNPSPTVILMSKAIGVTSCAKSVMTDSSNSVAELTEMYLPEHTAHRQHTREHRAYAQPEDHRMVGDMLFKINPRFCLRSSCYGCFTSIHFAMGKYPPMWVTAFCKRVLVALMHWQTVF